MPQGQRDPVHTQQRGKAPIRKQAATSSDGSKVAFLAEHRNKGVGVTMPEFVIVFEPRDLVHVRLIQCSIGWPSFFSIDGK
jgi:hypothetical protein